jgi:hypothetical protein
MSLLVPAASRTNQRPDYSAAKSIHSAKDVRAGQPGHGQADERQRLPMRCANRYWRGVTDPDDRVARPGAYPSDNLWRHPWPSSAVMLTTVIVVVATHDLAQGVLAGVLLSGIFFAGKGQRMFAVPKCRSLGSDQQRGQALAAFRDGGGQLRLREMGAAISTTAIPRASAARFMASPKRCVLKFNLTGIVLCLNNICRRKIQGQCMFGVAYDLCLPLYGKVMHRRCIKAVHLQPICVPALYALS